LNSRYNHLISYEAKARLGHYQNIRTLSQLKG
jgi:hypothetical protein